MTTTTDPALLATGTTYRHGHAVAVGQLLVLPTCAGPDDGDAYGWAVRVTPVGDGCSAGSHAEHLHPTVGWIRRYDDAATGPAAFFSTLDDALAAAAVDDIVANGRTYPQVLAARAH